MGVNAQEGRLVIANRIKAALCAFSRWCWQRGYTETGVGAGLLKAGIEKARERTLSVCEFREVHQATVELGPVRGPLFRSLILTGRRRWETLSLVRSRVDLEKATITKPGSEIKK